MNGVTMLDPRQTFIDVTVSLGRDITHLPRHASCRARRRSATAARSARTPGSSTAPSAPACVVENTVGRDSEVGDGARVGPFAILPPGSSVAAGAVTGRLLHCPHGLTRGKATPMEKLTTKRLALYSGRTHPALAEEVADHLGLELGDPNLIEFANGEMRPRFAESIRGSDVFIMQSHYGVDGRSINDSIMEQLIMIDTAYRASAKRITAVCPFYGYARQDRKAEGREPITARLIADMFKSAGAKRMVSIDLHSGQIQGFFDGPVDHLTAMPVLEDYVRTHADNPVIVSPDAGRIKVAERMAQHLERQGRRPGVHLQAPARRARPTSPRPRR